MSSQPRKPPADGQPPEKPQKPASPGRYSLSTENSTEAVGVRIDSTRIAAVRPPDGKDPPQEKAAKTTARRNTLQMTSDPPAAPSNPPSGGAAAALAAAVPPPGGAPATVRGPGLPPPVPPARNPPPLPTSTQRMNMPPPLPAETPKPKPVGTATVRMSVPGAPPPPPPPLPKRSSTPEPVKNPRATTVGQPVAKAPAEAPKPRASPLASSMPPDATEHADADARIAPAQVPQVVITPIEGRGARSAERPESSPTVNDVPPPTEVAPKPFVPSNPGQESMIVDPGTVPPVSPRMRGGSGRPSKSPSGFPGFDEGSLAHAFDALMAEGPSGEGKLESFDLGPVRELFAELAASHMRHVRDFMLDVKWGEATIEWVEICVPACMSLRRASERLDLKDLTQGLELFADALKDAGARGGVTIDGEPKQKLVDAYAKLVEILPQAFALDSDKSEREAVIVQALLLQIPDVRKVTIDKLHAAGLTSLKTLWEATPFEIAQVSGITEILATRIVERFEEYRQELRESRPSDARAAEREKLAELLATLKEQNNGYEEAARGWSPDAKAKKRDLMRAREDTWLAISLLLARFGEVERLTGIEKVPYAQRIAQLEGWLDEAAQKYRLGD
jgi:hypothetical protein